MLVPDLWPNLGTVFTRLNAAAFVNFFVIQVPPLFEGGVNLKSNLFLANNSMVRALKYTHFELINIVINELPHILVF